MMREEAKGKAAAAWAQARGLRSMLEQTMNREQRKELGALLTLWRNAHLYDALAIGGEKFERVASDLLGEKENDDVD